MHILQFKALFEIYKEKKKSINLLQNIFIIIQYALNIEVQ